MIFLLFCEQRLQSELNMLLFWQFLLWWFLELCICFLLEKMKKSIKPKRWLFGPWLEFWFQPVHGWLSIWSMPLKLTNLYEKTSLNHVRVCPLIPSTFCRKPQRSDDSRSNQYLSERWWNRYYITSPSLWKRGDFLSFMDYRDWSIFVLLI